MLWLLTSRHWTGPRPINSYVIEHRDGLVLFDTGQDRASVTDPGYFPGGVTGVLYDRLARFEIGPQDTLSAGLDAASRAASSQALRRAGRGPGGAAARPHASAFGVPTLRPAVGATRAVSR